jgi:hypothetical protein
MCVCLGLMGWMVGTKVCYVFVAVMVVLYIGILWVQKVYPESVQKYLVQLWVKIGTVLHEGLGTLFVPKVGKYF